MNGAARTRRRAVRCDLCVSGAATIIFIAALFAILYYFGIMQVVVPQCSPWLMHRVMQASGAESLNVAASIFMGQTEAPLTIRRPWRR